MQSQPPAEESTPARARPPTTSAEASDFSDTDDESYFNRDSNGSGHQQQSDGGYDFEANDVDPDAQIEALDEIIFGTSTTVLLSENEHAVKLTMQLIRESVRTASAIERKSEGDTGDESDGPDLLEVRRAQEQQQQQQQLAPELEEEQEIDALLQKKTLRLDWLNIGKIENLDAFTHIQELYLQHNLLRAIENLDNHQYLTFLALGGNRIEKVEGLHHLKNLKFLDLSNNCIEDFDIREFPESLMILRLAGNPFIRHMPSYVHLFFERLPNLVQVDHFRRAQSPSYDENDNESGTTNSDQRAARSGFLTTSAVYSPRSRYVELEMEVELSHSLLAASSPPSSLGAAARQSDVDSELDVMLEEFDLSAYEEQRKQRLASWKQQLKNIETREAELGGGSGGGGSGASAAAASLHSKTLERVQAATKSAIAESISHFQQMELEHKEWQENQQQQHHQNVSS